MRISAFLGLTSAGCDTGSFQFEKESLRRQTGFYRTYFEQRLNIMPVKIRLESLDTDNGENPLFQSVLSYLQTAEPAWLLEIISSSRQEQAYYRHLQFKIAIPLAGMGDIEIADGGFTDWTQRLNGNRKEWLLISGIGLEYLDKNRGCVKSLLPQIYADYFQV